MNNNKLPLVSILVLNYNGKQFLDDCFSSLLDSSYPNYEIIMIDNLSTDDSVAYTEEKYPQVKVFQNGINGGFSLAYNNAFKIAKGKYFVVLNNDVKVDKNWLEPLVTLCENDEQTGAVQPKLLSLLEPHKFEYAGASGGYLDKYGYAFTRGRIIDFIESDAGQYNDITEVFWTTGAAMMIRASILPETGDMDVDFMHHYEEIDLCYRINLAGYKLQVAPESVVYHYGGGIIQYQSYKKLYWNHRNSIFMMLKSLEKKNLFSFIVIRFLLDLMTFCWALVKWEKLRLKALINAYLWLIKHISLIKNKRKFVQQIRKVDDNYIFKKMYPKSVALQYFISKKKTFSELMSKQK